MLLRMMLSPPVPVDGMKRRYHQCRFALLFVPLRELFRHHLLSVTLNGEVVQRYAQGHAHFEERNHKHIVYFAAGTPLARSFSATITEK